MSATWQRWSRRIDGMSLRERVFLFLCLAMLLMAVADQAVIAPALRSQRAAQGPLQQEARELANLRSQLLALSQPAPEAAGAASSPVRLQQALAQAAAERSALVARLNPPPLPGTPSTAALPDLLTQVLQRHGRLTLQSLNTRPKAAATSGATSATSVAASAPVTGRDDTGWSSAELKVSGPYTDLQRFLVALETQLPGLQWGELQLDTQPAPPVLNVTVWLPGGTP